MNDTFQEIGAALGVAVLRRIVTATYRSGLPASAPDAARGSYGRHWPSPAARAPRAPGSPQPPDPRSTSPCSTAWSGGV